MSDKPDGSFRISDLVDMDNEHAARTLIRHAADVRASDLFFMTNEKSLQVSIRRLGSLEKVAVVPLEMGRHMIGFVKAMAGMDIAEHRRPLDGRWIDTFDGKQLDLRINTVPTLFGEDMTLRIWDREVGLFDLDELGMARHDYGRLINMLSRPSGLILVTGPTGTGKTTTLYACLQHLNDGQRKINTLEDPVEYEFAAIRQTEIRERIGLTFASSLRALLRQNPDVILVGETR
ncbi:MAG: Flp pilus assembly complex ATPase component TadA, partial [Planctomycetales bacterium]|nr:Flp pilus assembly complex ATPase component TadA [Planctomycetales bacterium]